MNEQFYLVSRPMIKIYLHQMLICLWVFPPICIFCLKEIKLLDFRHIITRTLDFAKYKVHLKRVCETQVTSVLGVAVIPSA